jgi:hypothetical protein
METLLPVIDTEVLQKRANEYAMQGAEASIKEFYTGWNSPYRKAIDAELNKLKVGTGIELPDVVALINEALSQAVDEIANAALAKTFIPQVKRFLTRVDAEIPFSDILKEFIETGSDIEPGDCDCSIDKDAKYGWLTIEISDGKRNYNFTLHVDHNTEKQQQKYGEKITLYVDDAKIELPFTRNVLQDNFVSYLASIVLCNSKITMDCDGFEDNMFPERCHCH